MKLRPSERVARQPRTSVEERVWRQAFTAALAGTAAAATVPLEKCAEQYAELAAAIADYAVVEWRARGFVAEGSCGHCFYCGLPLEERGFCRGCAAVQR